MWRSLFTLLLLVFTFNVPVQADVTFECDECLNVVLQFDNSGSMFSDPDRSKIGRAKAGAKELVNRLKDGDSVAITTYAGTAQVELAMTTIETAADRDTICDAIDAIADGGSSTNIGDALRLSLDELQDNRGDGCNELIVIVGDGDHSTGTETPGDVIPDLQDDGVAVTTFALDDDLLDLPAIATATGGCSFTDVKWWQVYQLYVRTAVGALGKSVILDSPSTEMTTDEVAEGDSDSFDFEAEVPVDSTCATFCIAINRALSATSDWSIHCELTSPSGDVTGGFDVTQDCCFDVFDPEPGTWTVSLVFTLNDCAGELCTDTITRKTRVFASAAQCPLSFVECDYSELGDVVGVDGDGVPTAYESIQAAVDAANDDGLETIFVFESETGSTVQIRDLTDVEIIACGDVTVRRLKIKSCENVTIRGFDVAARGKTYACKIYSYSYANDGVHFVGCSFSGAGTTGVQVGDGNDGITMTDCSATDNGKYGVWFQGGGLGAQLVECILDGNGRHGLRVQGDLELLVEECEITNNAKAGMFSYCLEDCDPTLVTLVENLFEGNGGDVAPNNDENIGFIDHIIDETDSQPGYEVPAAPETP